MKNNTLQKNSLQNKNANLTPLRYMLGYALGNGVISITINGTSNLAMLYYAQILQLNMASLGIALAIPLIWDAISDPLMGFITDRTKTRFGSKIPYILLGGILLSLVFYLIWNVPLSWDKNLTFYYVIFLNILFRTCLTIFMVPYAALGYEICTNYIQRSKLQGISNCVNQISNFAFSGLAWGLFFKDKILEDGSILDGTKIASNYFDISIVLSAAIFIFTIACVFSTRKYAKPNIENNNINNQIKNTSFLKDAISILTDKNAICVFVFLGIIQLAFMLVSQIQMFTYVDYMHFSANEKSIVHSSGMISYAVFALFVSYFVKKFDKKPVGFISIGMCLFGGIGLFLIYKLGLSLPEDTINICGFQISLGVIIFIIFQGIWWGGGGLVIPLTTSMVADISEINRNKTGKLKDASYAAFFSFFMKGACAIGLFLTSKVMALAGYNSAEKIQSADVSQTLAYVTFLGGPVIMIFSIVALIFYPVNDKYLKESRKNSKFYNEN